MSDRVTWAQVDRGLYVGSRTGEYVGMVEATPSGAFVAIDGTSTPVGRFDDLRAAQSAVRTAPTNRTSPFLRRGQRVVMAAATAAGTVAASLALTAGFLVIAP